MSPWTFFPRNRCPRGQRYLGKIVRGTAIHRKKCLGDSGSGGGGGGGTEFPTTPGQKNLSLEQKVSETFCPSLKLFVHCYNVTTVKNR